MDTSRTLATPARRRLGRAVAALAILALLLASVAPATAQDDPPPPPADQAGATVDTGDTDDTVDEVGTAVVPTLAPPPDAVLQRDAFYVSGGVTPSEAEPYMARIRNQEGNTTGLCTGSLISERWVVTAAHCININAVTTVDLGRLNVNNGQEGITRTATQKFVDSRWNNANNAGGDCFNSFCDYDVGLLRLDVDVPSTWEVAPLTPESLALDPPNEVPIYRGYGLIDDSPPTQATQLQSTRPGDFEMSDPCFSPPNIDDFYCMHKEAGARTEGGDSGGPWLIDRDGNEMLFGVHSGIITSGPDTWSLATHVVDVSWINGTAGVESFPAGAVLADQNSSARWFVHGNGFRTRIQNLAAANCLVGKGATQFNVTSVQYTAVPLLDGNISCTPGDWLAVPGSLEDLGALTNAGSVTVLNANSSGNAAGSTAVHQDSPGVPGVAEAGDRHGRSVVWADVNGDGIDDLVMGAPYERIGSIRAGSVTVVLFDATGPTSSGTVIHQGTTGVPGGNESGDLFGWALAAADVDGDGYTDVIVGSPGETLGSADGTGAIVVLFGSQNGLTGAGAQAFHQGTTGVPGGNESGDHFGYAVATAGATSGDDMFVAVGAPHEDIGSNVDAGSVTLFATGPGGIVPVPDLLYQGATPSGVRPDMPGASEAGDQWGYSLAGHADGVLAIGAPFEDIGSVADTGALTVYDGFDGSPRAMPVHQGTAGVPGNNETGDRWAFSLAAGLIGGTSVIVVGVPYESIGSDIQTGAIAVLPGVVPGGAVTGATSFHQGSAGVPGANETNDLFGYRVATHPAGLFMATAPFEDIGTKDDTGSVTVFYGTAFDPDDDGVVAYHQNTPAMPGNNETDDRFGA